MSLTNRGLMSIEKHIIMSGGSIKHPIKCPSCQKQLTLRLNQMGLPELCNQCVKDQESTLRKTLCVNCHKLSVWA